MLKAEENVSTEERKQKIRARYKGVSRDELEFIPAKPKASIDDDYSVKRVAAYCRVSTDDPNQTSSYELQRNHYQEYIKEHEGWTFVDVYADEGISGTSLNHRDDFHRMIRDCNEGKIDLIITKSVSRFARNIVDCIKTVRELANGKYHIGVLFETEHIYTLDGSSEMMLAVLSAAAQEESHTKSEIMNISIEQRFSRGIFLTPELLGYDRDEDGNLVVNEMEAETVKVIYDLYLNGFSFTEIAEILEKYQRLTKAGNTKWSASTIRGVIENERHCGDVLARKTFTPNYLDHKAKKNNNDRNQYRQRDHHEAIVSRDVYYAAMKKMKSGDGNSIPILSVIDSGVLKGFVPVSRKWNSFSGEDYDTASRSAYDELRDKSRKSKSKKEQLSLDGYKIVSGQCFISTEAPCLTIADGKMSFSTACLKKFKDVRYVELLLNTVEKCIAIRPCEADNPNAIEWGVLQNERWVARPKSCRGFAAALFDIMEWAQEIRYKFRGEFIEKNGQKLLFFSLANPSMSKRKEIDILDTQNEAEEVKAEKKTVIEKIPAKSIFKYFGTSLYELRHAHVIEAVHYSGDWDVLRPAKPVEGLNEVTPDWLDSLMEEADEILERWAG